MLKKKIPTTKVFFFKFFIKVLRPNAAFLCFFGVSVLECGIEDYFI